MANGRTEAEGAGSLSRSAGEGRGGGEPSPLPSFRVRGRWPLPGRRVAIVGARRPTPYGEAVAERLAAELAAAGVVVVSGMAPGVDSAAHRGALDGGGSTVAVLGTGVDVPYPRANARLAQRIAESGGALLSQFPDGTPPRPANFPRRNWTMAALCEVVVVVEAAERSGALITADAALALGRTVMAVPGSIFSALSDGCHQLLRDGAGLVQDARDVLAELEGPGAVELAQWHRFDGGAGDGDGDGLLRHLSDVLPIEPGELARRLRRPVAEVLAGLTRLELEGEVARRGPAYVKLQRHGRRRERLG
jgi:DNA processing protein